ncbi:Protein CBG23284 [Caenorhabditis briggsae]|uniref:Uncharacterized protein n=2 Tax=Caenorhabditis briggsae TaxID=6238 RepID=A0AAE9D1J9_CAEBR|nr:Protein CBG23284 [Caenorhabditis briggsae]ULT89028.1 hypothetical protein L3Y34_007897 [Caenorhabditis briggsae]CAP39720.1 Protein CBG23284 [Caenorhabditis briggsae]
MSRFYSTSHHIQSTSTSTTMTASSATGAPDVNGGHCASPYLRRIRIPKLNTFRHHLEEDEDDDEWFEMQMAKNELIRLRMNELKNNRLKDRTNNNNGESKNVKTSKSFSLSSTANHGKTKQNKERSDDVEPRNGNSRCLRSSKEENKKSGEDMIETHASMQRCLWFHPKHLFNMSPQPEPTLKAKTISDRF